ncbi:hypothetical protein [Gimesia benthica]|uniref:hypothetical protein n=1 Tax=Gimesia benthica TaxID=2608982 RepID=UPI001D14FDFF|nr:hypothetical protein [Gimesia benthica]
MMFMRTKRRHQPGRIGSFLQRLRRGRARRLKNLRLNATVNSYSTVENLEDRTLLSAVNSLIDPNVYDSPADFNPDDYGTGISNSPNRGLTNQTQSQQRSQATVSEEDKQKHENDLGQVDSPSNPSQFSVNEGESIGTTGINDDIGSAQLISGLGTGMDDEFDADVTGYLSNATVSTFLFPFAEDDGSITLANDLGIVSGEQVTIQNAQLGNGPHGSAGTGTGDFDFYLVSGVQAGERISVSVRDSTQFFNLDPIVAIYSSSGFQLAFDDDGEPSSTVNWNTRLRWMAITTSWSPASTPVLRMIHSMKPVEMELEPTRGPKGHTT